MLRQEEKAVSIPKSIVVKDQKYEGDVTFAASEACHVEGVKTPGSLWIMAGVPPEQIDTVKETSEKAREFLEKDVFPLFGSSIKMMLRLGNDTFVETCTPDKDGKSRDEHHSVADGVIAKYALKSEETFKEDVQSAIENPANNLKILSIRKMR